MDTYNNFIDNATKHKSEEFNILILRRTLLTLKQIINLMNETLLFLRRIDKTLLILKQIMKQKNVILLILRSIGKNSSEFETNQETEECSSSDCENN